MNAGRLPNLLIAGVPKAGTTSLFGYLAQHPDICPSDEKEPGFFNQYHPLRDPERSAPSLSSYMAHFQGCSGERYAMEASPSYSYGGQAVIDAVRRVLGQPRVIITLRNPVDRLWSAYTFQRSLGNIPAIRSFDDYLETCQQRRREGSDRRGTSRLQGLAIGFYAEYVPAWLDAFGSDMKIVFAEEMARAPHTVLAEILSWLGLGPAESERLDLGSRNVTEHARNPRLANVAYALKRAGDRIGVLRPAFREPLRRAYRKLNTGTLNERFEPAARSRVEAIYRESNAASARALIAHGYTDLPAWLKDAALHE